MLKTGRGLDPGASAIEIDGGEVEVAFVESGFEARYFGTEPADNIAVGVNRDADLALLDDGVNLDRAEDVGADADMHLCVHLFVHLHIGWGTGHDGCGRLGKRRGRRGVKHLVSLWKLGRGYGSGCGPGTGN